MTHPLSVFRDYLGPGRLLMTAWLAAFLRQGMWESRREKSEYQEWSQSCHPRLPALMSTVFVGIREGEDSVVRGRQGKGGTGHRWR